MWEEHRGNLFVLKSNVNVSHVSVFQELTNLSYRNLYELPWNSIVNVEMASWFGDQP